MSALQSVMQTNANTLMFKSNTLATVKLNRIKSGNRYRVYCNRGNGIFHHTFSTEKSAIKCFRNFVQLYCTRKGVRYLKSLKFPH